VPETKSHFQLSFTARQAMLVFVGLWLALGVAFFLGVMTGLSGRRVAAASAEATPAARPEAEATLTPVAVAENRATPETVRTTSPPIAFPKPVLGTEPTAVPGLQLFEDSGGPEPTPARRGAKPAAAVTAPPSGEFWVQVASVRSEKEAKAVRERLSRRGHHVSVSPASGPKGTLFRVRVGPFSSRERAAKIAADLSRQEKLQTWIVPAGK
jgi:DedD protein